MNETTPEATPAPAPKPMHSSRIALIAIVAGLIGGVGGSALLGVLGGHQGGDQAIRDYILSHPEILPEAMDTLRQREAEKQISSARAVVEAPFPGAVLGNPNGRKVLVEFMDYACGYCRKAEGDTAALVAGDKEVKVVFRQLPILTPASKDAAAMALAAAEQGKFAVFHHAMFAAGHPDAASIAAAAQTAGLDMARARKVAASEAVKAEIASNLDMANQLGLRSTPTWVASGHLVLGAVGGEELAKALNTPKG